MFEIRSIKAVRKDLEKLSPEILRDAETVHFKSIRENPFQSDDWDMPSGGCGPIISGTKVCHTESFTRFLRKMSLLS